MNPKLLHLPVCIFGILCASALLTGCKSDSRSVDAVDPYAGAVDSLLSRMTLDEKIYQLNQYILGANTNANNIGETVKEVPAEIGSLIYFPSDPTLRNELQRKAVEESRLGIPILFGFDVIHGWRTIFPIPLAQACSWNPALVTQSCGIAAAEARQSGVEWTFSPMIDVARDGRWGRVAEGYGEDPYANGRFAVAAVQGYQGDDLSDSLHVAACLKHYVAYGASEAGRDYVYSEVSPQTLWDTYLPPYEAGVKAGAATLMSAFNDLNGTPATANPYTLTDILKKRWKHDGFVVSDWEAVAQLAAQGVAADGKEAAQKAFNAGVEMDMKDDLYRQHLKALYKEGKVSQAAIDDAVRRVLRLKFRLGLFDRPYTPVVPEAERVLLPQSIRVAAQMASETMVLLKNNSRLLPLKAGQTLALIGPMAKNKRNLLGSWSAHGKPDDVTSIYEGLAAEGNHRLLYAPGCDFDGNDRSGFAAALEAARKAAVVVLCLGEKREWSGENASRSTLSLPAIQEELAAEVRKAGKPVVLLLSNGRPLELCRLEPLADAILEVWQPGIAGGKPIAGILSGRINPSGKLAITFPRTTGQIPIYYNHRQSARTHQGKYQAAPSEPLYGFGHGLSYTSYEYGDIVVPKTEFERGEKFTAEVSVKNTGSRDGIEVVHWFIRDPVCSISRPVKELKYFDKQLIPAGESRTFRFEIDPERDLSFVNRLGERFLEFGDYFIIAGDKQLKLTLN
jgi:beta-glucosidase